MNQNIAQAKLETKALGSIVESRQLPNKNLTSENIF